MRERKSPPAILATTHVMELALAMGYFVMNMIPGRIMIRSRSKFGVRDVPSGNWLRHQIMIRRPTCKIIITGSGFGYSQIVSRADSQGVRWGDERERERRLPLRSALRECQHALWMRRLRFKPRC